MSPRPRLSRLALTVSLLSLGALSTGCTSTEMTIPDTFVRLDDAEQARQGFEIRAVSNAGIVLGVQVVDHDEAGTLAFWSEAVTRRIRDAEGYALLGTDAIRARSGEEGALMRFGRDVRGRPYRYTVALYVTERHLYLAAAGGPEEAFVDAEDEVEAALASLDLR